MNAPCHTYEALWRGQLHRAARHFRDVANYEARGSFLRRLNSILWRGHAKRPYKVACEVVPCFSF